MILLISFVVTRRVQKRIKLPKSALIANDLKRKQFYGSAGGLYEL